MTTSGTYSFELSNADIVLEAFDRCEIRPSAITAEHMVSAKRSVNLELQRWSNLGVNLWAVDLISIPLIQGVTTYTVPSETVSLLDVYLRTFTVTNTFNFAPNFSIVNLSTTVTIVITNHGLVTGNWINITTPISIGNLLLYGFYQVVNTVSNNSFTITSPVAATSTISNGGAVPIFTGVIGQTSFNVNLPNHGMVTGNLFNIAVSTVVSGITLLGAYTVSGVVNSSNFTISTLQQAISNDTKSENGGLAQVLGQTLGVNPVDDTMTPLGRTDYSMMPDKFVQGKPNVYWFNRQINPNVTVWQAPDQNGPYVMQCYRMRRCQDASPTMGQTPDIPYRFIDCFCAQLSVRLAMKYAKPMLATLGPAAKVAWDEAAIEDRERADIMILPMLDQYYRD